MRHAARARWRALPRRTQRTHSTPSSVTTVSSTGIFLATRSARRSDASNAAGRSAGGSLWRQREPGRKRRPRVETPAAHAQPGWHRHLAPRCARRSDASDTAGRSADGSLWRQWEPGRLQAAALARQRRTRAAVLASAPRCALRASLGRLRGSRAVGGRKHAEGRLPGCGARAFERSLAVIVSERAFGGRTLARALPRSYDRAWARRAGAPAPFRLRRPPWAATAQTARLACAHAAEDGRARSEPESA